MMRSKGVGGATAEQMRRYHEDRGPAAKAAMADKADEDKVKRMGEAYDRNVKTYARGGSVPATKTPPMPPIKEAPMPPIKQAPPTPIKEAPMPPPPTAQYAGRDPAPPMQSAGSKMKTSRPTSPTPPESIRVIPPEPVRVRSLDPAPPMQSAGSGKKQPPMKVPAPPDHPMPSPGPGLHPGQEPPSMAASPNRRFAPPGRAGNTRQYAKGGSVSSASSRGDGCAQRGHTKGKMR